MKGFLLEVWDGFWYTFVPLVLLALVLEISIIEGCVSAR